MSEFKALSRSFSRNALKKMGLGGSSSASPSGGSGDKGSALSRRVSRRKSQDGRETHKNRPHAIQDSDVTSLDENFIKTVIPKKESAQAIILEALQNSTLFKDMEHDQRVDVMLGAGRGCENPNFKGSNLGRFPLVSADFWTSEHLSERSRT